MAKVTTIGREMIREGLPDDLKHYADQPLDKKTSKRLFTELAAAHPDEYVDTLQKLMDVSTDVATDHGVYTSRGLDDLRLPKKVEAYRQKVIADIAKIEHSNLPIKEKQKRIVEYLLPVGAKVQKMLLDEGQREGNIFAISAAKGFRAKPAQVMKLLFGDVLVTDQNDRPLPIAMTTGYGEGVTPLQYLAGAYGSRRGYIGVQFATADTGYLSKQLSLLTHNMSVTQHDCGTKRGVEMNGSDPHILGYALAKDTGPYKAGTYVTKKMLPSLAGKTVLVRSVQTCDAPEGTCSVCAGLNERGETHKVGDYIGDSAKLTTEPMTQIMALSAKHSGGVAGQTDTHISGFDEIDQFFQMPQNYQGAAVLSPLDGKVAKVAKAPQGGAYVMVGGEQVYVPPTRKLKVKPGDIVEEGQILTDGIARLPDYAKLRGLGEARKYAADTFQELLEKNNITSHKRHADTVASGLVSLVRITDPRGYGRWNPGDMAYYSELANEYAPRDGSKQLPVDTARNMYLEAPALHYTIGTKLKPSMLKQLKKHGVRRVLVNKEPPPFEPAPVGSAQFSKNQPDWLVRMEGFDLSRGLLDSVNTAQKHKRDGSSYISKVIETVRI